MTYYKATRVDGTSFYDHKTKWGVGSITRIAGPARTTLCGPGILHASSELGETLGANVWPCRLFSIEPRGEVVTHPDILWKVGCKAWMVVEELPAWQLFGPNGERVVKLIDRCGTLTADDFTRLIAADKGPYTSLRLARYPHRDSHKNAAWDAVLYTLRDTLYMSENKRAYKRVIVDATTALVLYDLIPTDLFDALYSPWREVCGDV